MTERKERVCKGESYKRVPQETDLSETGSGVTEVIRVRNSRKLKVEFVLTESPNINRGIGRGIEKSRTFRF